MTTKLYESIDNADPNTICDIIRHLKLGSHMMQSRLVVRNRNAVTGDVITLPNMAKCSALISAYARAGTGTPGPLDISATPLTPGAGEVGIAADGDIIFNGADDWTSVDVEYSPIQGVEEVTLEGYPVLTNVLTLPASCVPAVHLLSVTGYTAAGIAVPCTVMDPGTATSAGEAEFDAAKATITFDAADAIVTADVEMLKTAETEVAAALEELSTFL